MRYRFIWNTQDIKKESQIKDFKLYTTNLARTKPYDSLSQPDSVCMRVSIPDNLCLIRHSSGEYDTTEDTRTIKELDPQVVSFKGIEDELTTKWNETDVFEIEPTIKHENKIVSYISAKYGKTKLYQKHLHFCLKHNKLMQEILNHCR